MKIEISPKQLIKGLIENESTLEDQLDLLTSIGTISRNKEVFKACESIRNELVADAPGEKEKADDVSKSGILLNGRKSRRGKSDNAGSLDQESEGKEE